VVVDNLANAKLAVLERLKELGAKELAFVKADIRDSAALDALFKSRRFDAVLHFAGLKAVGESVAKPALYQEVNVGGTRTLLQAMRRHGVRRFVFSSSATVYGEPEFLPYTEAHPLRPTNPYGETKLAVERLLAAEAGLAYACLRYFNPIGAHPSGRIGEDPRGVPDNLLPYVAQVAVGLRPALRVWGKDYATPDGTGVRDYIHVTDLAEGHLAALRYLISRNQPITVNLGTGRGHSVLEVVRAFEQASGVKIPLEFHPRRAGDIAEAYASCAVAKEQLGWTARHGLEEMVRDAWRWQQGNPNGYPD
jgi:UDP-glucose 4-epimerase